MAHELRGHRLRLIARTTTSLTLGDLAFFRSVALDGMSLVSASRFLPDRPPRPAARLATIRDTLVVAARLHRARAIAALLERAQPMSIPAASELLSLDQFQAEYYPGVDLSERELLALMAERYPTFERRARGQRRREANRRRLQRAVNWLGERLIARPAVRPRAPDPVGAWLVQTLADQLESAGLATLGELTGHIATRGARWHVSVDGIGAGKARRIVEWLRREIPEFDQYVGDFAMLPLAQQKPALEARRSIETAVVPFEYFCAPLAVAGTVDRNRRLPDAGGIAARDDREAVGEWFKTKLTAHQITSDKPADRVKNHTYRAYRREVERLWMWAVLARGKALSALDVDDVIAYETFLYDPRPAATWIGPRRPRWHPEWRPFARVPSPASRELALTAVQSLFEFWVQRGYVPLNPWRAGPKRDAAPRAQFREKALSVGEWDQVRDHVRALPAGEAQARRKAVLTLLYGSGLRREELAAVTIAGLNPGTDDDGIQYWELAVIGKGRRARIVPVIEPAVAALKAYFSYRFGQADLPNAPAAEPLIASLPGPQLKRRERRRLSPWAINAIVTKAVREAATAGVHAPRLRKASCHSLRHTFATHALQLDPQALPHIQKILGHASIVTTANNYLTTDRDDRRKVANRLAARAKI